MSDNHRLPPEEFERDLNPHLDWSDRIKLPNYIDDSKPDEDFQTTRFQNEYLLGPKNKGKKKDHPDYIWGYYIDEDIDHLIEVHFSPEYKRFIAEFTINNITFFQPVLPSDDNWFVKDENSSPIRINNETLKKLKRKSIDVRKNSNQES